MFLRSFAQCLRSPGGLSWGAVSPGMAAGTTRNGGCFRQSVRAEGGAELSLPSREAGGEPCSPPSVWSLLSLRALLSVLTCQTLPSRPALSSLTLSVCLLRWESVSPSLWLQTQWVMPWSQESRNQFLQGPSRSLPRLFLPLQGEVPLPKWNKLVQTVSSAGPPLVGGREGAVGTALDTKQPATLWLLPPAPCWPPPPPPPCLHAPSLFHSLSFP